MELETDRKSNIGKNTGYVVSSNILIICLLALYNFFAPKYLTVEQYAHIKYYDLYINYAGLMHLGFINGIYLKFGKYNYEQLPKGEFRLYSQFLLLFQILISGILFLFVGMLCNNKSILEVLVFICINIVLINVACYFSLINQFTCRFILDSRILYIKAAVYLLLTILIVMGKADNYKCILFGITVMNFTVLSANILFNRHLIFGKPDTGAVKNISGYFKSGFFVMFSELIALIVLAIDSLFVSNLFDEKNFAVYSFAVAVISMLYMIINTISSLIYPYLVRIPQKQYSELYRKISGIISAIVLLMLTCIVIIRWIIPLIIPEYEASMNIIYILLPTVLYKALMTLVSGNFYKALNMPKKMFFNNVFGLMVAVLLNTVLYVSFRSISAIAIGSVITFIVWMFVTDLHFNKIIELSVSYILLKNVYLFMCVIAFYFCFSYKNSIIYTILYILIIAVLTTIFLKALFGKKPEQ